MAGGQAGEGRDLAGAVESAQISKFAKDGEGHDAADSGDGQEQGQVVTEVASKGAYARSAAGDSTLMGGQPCNRPSAKPGERGGFFLQSWQGAQ